MATEMEGSSIGEDPKERKSVKILILGGLGVGKSTFIKTYLDLDDIPVDQSIFQQYHVRIEYDGKEVDGFLFDLNPGRLAFERRKSYPTSVNAILLCFSVRNYESLKSVYNLWIHEVRAHFGELIPIFLVGLKSDVRLSCCPTEILSSPNPDDRMVEKSEAEEFHKKCCFYGNYMECSMHDKVSIVNVFNKAFIAAVGD